MSASEVKKLCTLLVESYGACWTTVLGYVAMVAPDEVVGLRDSVLVRGFVDFGPALIMALM